MKITENELICLATIGACNESIYYQEHKDPEKVRRFNAIIEALIEAKSLAELIENPT